MKCRVVTSELILIRCVPCRWKEDRSKGDWQDALLKGISAGKQVLVALRYAGQGGIHCHKTLSSGMAQDLTDIGGFIVQY